MASTGHQDSPTGAIPIQNISSHQGNMIDAQQRQQQELIKLIAQHFHNQFYQLTNNTTTNGPSAPQQQQQQQQLNRSRLPTSIAQYQSQQQQHYQNITGFPMNVGRPLDLNTMNHLLATSQSQAHHYLPNHLMRSQQMNPTSSSGSAASLGIPDSSCLDFSSLPSGVSPGSYANMVDLSLFNALGLNLINSQLANSPHRQPSLAHNTIGRQFPETHVSGIEVERPPQQTVNRGTKNISIGNNNDLDQLNQQDGRELLKFSINTILGRASPKSTSPLNEDSRGDRTYNESGGDDSKDNCDQNMEPKLTRAKDRGDSQLRVLDCDLASEYIGSNSSSANSTPGPQPSGAAGSSISVKMPFNNHQQRSSGPSDQLSANYQSGNFITQGSVGVGSGGGGGVGGGGVNGAPNVQRPTQPNQQLSCHPPPPPLFLTGSNPFPWTVAARGKPRRGMMRRAVFSDSQRVGLEKRFQLQKYISKPDRKKLAEKLGLRDSQVKIWFQNRRMKWRNSKERELLSAGGSREQTLPTRNNPNPDLSDVGETVKRLTSAIGGGPSSNNSQSK